MVSKRVRDLSTASPIDTAAYVPLDPAVGSARKATLLDAVKRVLETDANLQIGASGSAAVNVGASMQVIDGDQIYLLAPMSMEGFELQALAHPTAQRSAAPRARYIRDAGTASTDMLTVSDLGKTVRYARAGSVAVTLPDLSAAWSGLMEESIDFIFADAATDATFTPSGAGVKLNESTSPWARGASAGRVRFSSTDGKRWYR